MDTAFQDFWVTDIHFVIHRAAEPNQGNRSLCYPDRYTMVYCLSGKGSFRTDGKTILMLPGDVCLLPPGNSRAYQADPEDPWHFISVSFCLSFPEPAPTSTKAVYFPDAPAAVRGLFLQLSATWQQKDIFYKLQCRTGIQQILHQLFARHLEAAKPVPLPIAAAKQYIQQHFTQTIDLDRLAAEAGFSQSHFRKLFTLHIGRSPKQYILYLRLSKARDLLSSGSFRIAETAAACGFQNEFYFSTLFKQAYGCSPLAYRSKLSDGSQEEP